MDLCRGCSKPLIVEAGQLAYYHKPCRKEGRKQYRKKVKSREIKEVIRPIIIESRSANRGKKPKNRELYRASHKSKVKILTRAKNKAARIFRRLIRLKNN